MLDPRSGTIRVYALVGVGVALEEMCPCGGGYPPSCLEDSGLPASFRTRHRTLLLPQHHACLDAAMLPALMIMD